MKPKEAPYTIVIFRGHTANPWRLSLSRRLVRVTLAFAICFIVAEAILLAQYVAKTGELWELRALREEVLSVREQTTAFSTAMEDLKHRLLAMREVNQRLRVMLGIDEQKTEDPFNGRGGDERPIVGDVQRSSSPEKSQQEVTPQSAPEPIDQRSEADPRTEKVVMSKLEEELAQLQGAARVEERILNDLTKAAREMIDKLAATPSIRPVEGWVTSGFGPRVSPFTQELAMHDGLDIGAPPDTPIKAPGGGRVVSAGHDPKMGNTVAIDHGYGFETQYGHLSKILVRQGQRVRRGETIGLVGSTGLSTGPHLHYMVKVNDRTVDPERYILN